MIDLKDLRRDPDRYRRAATDKQMSSRTVDELLEQDGELRLLQSKLEELTAEKNRISKDIGKIAARLKKADGQEKTALQQEMAHLKQRPNQIKLLEQELGQKITPLANRRDQLWLELALPADPKVPVGRSADDNVELRCWHPDWFDPSRSFAQNKGFEPASHVELMQALGMVDFERGVKIAGTRSYVLRQAGMQLHQAVLRFGFDFMTNEKGFEAVSVPVLVREDCMVGTGFFPHAKDQAYHVANPTGDNELYLTGTGEVGLMALHQDEIIDVERLPLCYTTVSSCFRREAGATGKDTAGLFRIHQFDKVEQVVICRADETTSNQWHQKMIGFVETLLQRLELPYRLLQCCTADLGPKNADMIDIECWMPSRGPEQALGVPAGAFAETHSASKLYDFQCRRVNLRYRDPESKKTVFCHSLNNTVVASPRILIPIVEMYQNQDGTITVPKALRAYLNGIEKIGKK